MNIPYEELFFRNSGTLTAKEQLRLRSTKVVIIGLGGTGGFVLENLARVGIENFILFDYDRFELSNMNRQTLSKLSNLDTYKTKAAVLRLKEINPGAIANTFNKKFQRSDFSKLKGCDIVVDATDNIDARFEISEACSKLSLPFVFSSAAFSRGMVSVFSPKLKFKQVFQFPRTKFLKCRSVICTTPAFAGTLAATQAINYLLGKKFVKAPEFLFFDLFSKEILWKKRI